MSRSYEKITNLEPMEMTFTVEDADLDKLNEILKDINVKECPWFEVHDRHGNKARYYREPHWIPCTPKTMPDTNRDVLLRFDNSMGVGFWEHNSWGINTGDNIYSEIGEREAQPIEWCELPEPCQPEEESE